MRATARSVLCLCAVLVFAAPAAVRAQPGSASVRPAAEPHAVGDYTGVSPGSGNLPPRAPTPGSGARLVTWPGFQVRPDGASRFFVQTTGPVSTEVVEEAGRVVVILKDTGIHLRNNRRPLETEYFNTPVARARVERRGRNAAIVLFLRSNVRPRVTTERATNGFHFVMIEFPPGDYVPAELRQSSAAPAADPEAAPPPPRAPQGRSSQATDDERPPAFQ